MVGIGAYYLYFTPINYIGIDMNPSIELAINRFNKVVDIIPLNKEADILISDLKLKNQDIDDAMKTIIDDAINLGYINGLAKDNVIVFSVYADKEENKFKMEDELYNQMSQYMSDNNISSLLLFDQNNKERLKDANHYGISYDKMSLIHKAIVLDPTLDLSTLIYYSTSEIVTIIKEARVKMVGSNLSNKEELIAKKRELRNLYNENYNKKIAELCFESGNTNCNIENEIKEQVVQNEKLEIQKEIELVRDQLRGDWCNQVDNLNNQVDAGIKNKIKNFRNKWLVTNKRES
jgi:hypothetical protein